MRYIGGRISWNLGAALPNLIKQGVRVIILTSYLAWESKSGSAKNVLFSYVKNVL